MRRFGWQIGGVGFALALIVGLGLLAFGCGSGATPAVRGTPTATARPTATADARVAMVEAAARRYVDALADSMKTGSAQVLNSLSVPGSQAAGDAGLEAGVVHDKHIAFVTTQIDVTNYSADVSSASAEVSLDYSFRGYDADWPSLVPRGTPRLIKSHWLLDFSYVDGAWLVDTAQ